MPGKLARSDPRPSVRITRGARSGQHLASVLQEGRENANIDASLGFIWRISVYFVKSKSCYEKRPFNFPMGARGVCGRSDVGHRPNLTCLVPV